MMTIIMIMKIMLMMMMMMMIVEIEFWNSSFAATKNRSKHIKSITARQKSTNDNEDGEVDDH